MLKMVVLIPDGKNFEKKNNTKVPFFKKRFRLVHLAVTINATHSLLGHGIQRKLFYKNYFNKNNRIFDEVKK